MFTFTLQTIRHKTNKLIQMKATNAEEKTESKLTFKVKGFVVILSML